MDFVVKGPMFRTILTLIVFTGVLNSGLSQSVSDSNSVLFGWSLDDNFIVPVKVDVDTGLINFQLHNTVFRKYTSLTTIGSNGSPYLANGFFQRQNDDDLLFLNSYNDYFNTYSNTVYINSKKPFTNLQYMQSWPESDREEFFKAFHSQNVNERFNFGFDVSIVSDKSQFKYQNTNTKAFKIFSSYIGKRYSIHSSFNLNRYKSGESGGIVDTSYFSDWQFSKNIDTYFTGIDGSGTNRYTPNVTNRIRYVDAMVSQSYKLFTIGNKQDSLIANKSMAQPMLSYVFKVRRASKIYTSTDTLNNQYYKNNYSNFSETYDSIAEFKLTNTIQLDFKTKLRNKVNAGIYANINHDYLKYTYYSLLDSTLYDDSTPATPINAHGITKYDTVYDINSNESLSNIYVTGGIYGQFWTHFESEFNASLYIAGYKAGQTKLDGLVNTNIEILQHPYQLMLMGSIENIIPSYQLSNYYSNNYAWNTSFNSINRVHLSSKLAAPSNKFELEGHYSLLSNLIYLTDSMPEAHTGAISVSALTLQKEFVVWKFHSFSKLTYQVSENKSVIEIPSLILFNSTYVDQTWIFKSTGGKLRTMIGVDVYYNTKFNGYDYIPALSMFYQESNSYKVGGYPYIDAWINIRLKRARFFFKYEHINSSRDNLNNFYAVNYPSKLKAFKFGLSWTFYN
jgi:dolichol kinase